MNATTELLPTGTFKVRVEKLLLQLLFFFSLHKSKETFHCRGKDTNTRRAPRSSQLLNKFVPEKI
jgi:hypothetical protein